MVEHPQSCTEQYCVQVQVSDLLQVLLLPDTFSRIAGWFWVVLMASHIKRLGPMVTPSRKLRKEVH